MVTNINSQTYQFSESEKRTLEDCCSHTQSILNVINELKQKGCSTIPLILKCPMDELQTILQKTNSAAVMKKKKKKPLKAKTKLTGTELSDYLKSKIVIDSTASDAIYPPHGLLQSPATGRLYEILPYINNRLENMVKYTAKSTKLYFELGYYLQAAFKMWLWSKHRDEITGTWNQFLINNFGISGTYSRQLRQVSKKLYEYSGMHFVAIPFRELYRRRIDIQLMLEADREEAKFWSQSIAAAHPIATTTVTAQTTPPTRTETGMDWTAQPETNMTH